MFERRLSSNSNSSKSGFTTPLKSSPESVDSPFPPGISRYGRSHKPKMQDDYVSTDKKVSAYLKLSPGSQVQFFNPSKDPKKKASPRKSDDPEGSPKRGRPPKTPKSDTITSENELKMAVKAEPQDPSSPVDGCEWMVGDLAWARVGGHPFWPCIIALDPFQKIFTKIIRKGRTGSSQRWLHVQFFGDNGRRSWLNSNAVMSYSGRDAFVQLGDTILAGMRRKDPKQTSAFVIKAAVVQVWEKAVQEAEDLVDSPREDRISFFANLFPPAPPPQIMREQLIEKVMDQTEPVSPHKKRGRKRKAEQIPPTEEIKKKQIKVEEVKQEPVDTLLSSTPRTIADRKKRQALLIQLARSNQSPPSGSNTPSTPTPPTVADSPKVTTKPETDTPSRTSPTPKQIPLKRPATTESTVSTEKKKPKKKYVKKKVAADFQMFCSKHFDRVSDDHPELNQKEINKYLQKMWNEMDEAQKARYRLRFTGQEESESAEETSEDMEGSVEEVEEEVRSSKSSSPVPLATPMPKSSSSKRNICKYLFSGAKSEKVCQICEKAGDTVRCRGPCQGYYHPECITNPPIPQEPATPISSKGKKKKRNKKSLENSPASSDASQSEEQVENEATPVSSINKKRGRPKKISEPSPASSEAELVENEATPTSNLVRKRGRPKKGIDNTPALSAISQAEEQGQTKELSDKKEDSQLTKEIEETKKIEENGLVEKEDYEKKVPVVEVVEPEVMKGSAKVRKGSKDSESGEEGEGFRCKDCQEGRSQPCFVCHEYVHKKTEEAKLYRCITAYCGKVYHENCLKPWPQSSWRLNGNGKPGVMTCPQHTCHTCASDNPSVIKARYSNDKLVRCIRCPTTYHYGNYCLPAGSEILTNTQIICPQHYQPMRKGITQHVNAAWCFICASGGSLICCDLCPTAFHAACLNISTPPDGSYVCEECLTGRFPLYGEIVWVKLGNYRWWPAEILYPALIPDNILNLPHVRGEFAVRFFGSHDHYWVHRGRVFLYQDGDTAGKGSYKKSSVDHMFERAVKEASEAQRKYLEVKATREAETRPGMKPPNYVKLKANRPVGNVRTMEMNLSSLTPCECDPKTEAPCAPESDCLNRILMVECNPLICPAGEKCCNQLFEKRQYPPLQPYQTPERGWGLKTLVPLKKGDFVIEYVGEMIDEEEYKKRLNHMHENNEENFYFLTIDKDRMLDAGPKGNVARFMNHSCQPNCETQKWTVNGDTRVGLFAMCDIPANMELVFNYNLESIGSDKKPCMCGAPNCSGFIGVKANKNQEKEESKDKKVVKKKKVATVSKTHEEECFVCGEGGALLLCDGKHCTKGYHLSCLGKKQSPQGYWLCPWHQCNVCNKGRVRRCTFCVNSFCQEHSEGNISLDPVRGLLCNKHSQENSNTDGAQSNTADTSSTLMEIDEVSSENSTSALSQQSADSATKVELTNNNVVKPVNTPERRSRRSRSYHGDKPSTDTVVNGTVAKVTKRGVRPSSVDEKLIGSLKKTEQNGKQSPTTDETEKNSTGTRHVEELLAEVINTLPIKEANILETIGEEGINQGSEEKAELEESESTSSELLQNSLEQKLELSNEKLKFENLVTEKEEDCKMVTGTDEKSSKDSKVEEINDHVENEVVSKNSTTVDGSSTSTDLEVTQTISTKATEPLVTSFDKDNDEHNKEPKTENNSSEQKEISKIDALNQNDSLEVVTPAEKQIVANESLVEKEEGFLETNEVLENNDNQSNDLNQSVTENKNTVSSVQDYNMEELEKDKISVNSATEIQNEVVLNAADDPDRVKEKSVNEKLTKETEMSDKTCEDSSNKIVESKDNNEEVLTSTDVLEDDHIDDFELSYSEFSNDKVYHSKNVCNAESSIEMKLTDCTSSENGISKNIDEVNSKSDLASCLDQSSAMEVA